MAARKLEYSVESLEGVAGPSGVNISSQPHGNVKSNISGLKRKRKIKDVISNDDSSNKSEDSSGDSGKAKINLTVSIKTRKGRTKRRIRNLKKQMKQIKREMRRLNREIVRLKRKRGSDETSVESGKESLKEDVEKTSNVGCTDIGQGSIKKEIKMEAVGDNAEEKSVKEEREEEASEILCDNQLNGDEKSEPFGSDINNKDKELAADIIATMRVREESGNKYFDIKGVVNDIKRIDIQDTDDGIDGQDSVGTLSVDADNEYEEEDIGDCLSGDEKAMIDGACEKKDEASKFSDE